MPPAATRLDRLEPHRRDHRSPSGPAHRNRTGNSIECRISTCRRRSPQRHRCGDDAPREWRHRSRARCGSSPDGAETYAGPQLVRLLGDRLLERSAGIGKPACSQWSCAIGRVYAQGHIAQEYQTQGHHARPAHHAGGACARLRGPCSAAICGGAPTAATAVAAAPITGSLRRHRSREVARDPPLRSSVDGTRRGRRSNGTAEPPRRSVIRAIALHRELGVINEHRPSPRTCFSRRGKPWGARIARRPELRLHVDRC